MIDLVGGDAAIGDDICADARRLLGNGLAALIDNAVDEAGVVNRASIGNSGGDHGHLEWGCQNIALADGSVCREAVGPTGAGVDCGEPFRAGKDTRGLA